MELIVTSFAGAIVLLVGHFSAVVWNQLKRLNRAG